MQQFENEALQWSFEPAEVKQRLAIDDLNNNLFIGGK